MKLLGVGLKHVFWAPNLAVSFCSRDFLIYSYLKYLLKHSNYAKTRTMVMQLFENSLTCIKAVKQNKTRFCQGNSRGNDPLLPDS